MTTARPGTISPLALLSDKAMARQLGASETGRNEGKTLSRRVVARSLGAAIPANASKQAMRIDWFARAINKALMAKAPTSAGFAASSKTLSWQRPTWLLKTFYKVEKDVSAFDVDGPNWTTLAERTASLSMIDSAQNPSVNTQYRITAIAAMREDQEAQYVTVSTRATATLTATVNAPTPFLEGDTTSATLSATVGGTATGALSYRWSLAGIKNGVGTTSSADLGTLSSATAAAPVWTPPTDVDADVIVHFNLELTRGALRITPQGTTVIFQKTLTVDLTLGDVVGERSNFRYGGAPVLLRKIIGGNALFASPRPTPSLAYSILDSNDAAATSLGTLSTSKRTPGTTANLTTGEQLVYWHLPPMPSGMATLTTLAKIQLTATVGSESATDTEQAYLTNYVASFGVSINAVASGREGTTANLSATLSGNATGNVSYAWTVSHGTLDSATSATPTWTRPTVTGTVNATISLTCVRQNIEASASITSEVTDTPTAVTLTVQIGLWSGVIQYNNIERGTAYQCRAVLGGTATGTPTYRWFATQGRFTDTNTRVSTGIQPFLSTPSPESGITSLTLNCTVTRQGQTARASRVFALTGNVPVTPPPDPVDPTFSAAISGCPSAVQVSTTHNLSATSSGTLEGTTTYAWAVSSGGGSLSASTGSTTTWTAPAEAGSATITLTATRGTTVRTVTCQVTVSTEVPTLTCSISGAPAELVTGASTALTGSSSGGTSPVSFAWSVSGGGSFSSASSASTNYTAPASAGSVTITLTATDSGSPAQTATATASITVTTVVVPTLTVSITGAGTVNEGGTLTLGATLGGTATGTPTYAWSVDGGTLSSTTAAAPTWTAPEVTADTSYTVNLTVTRQGVSTAASPVTVTSRHVEGRFTAWISDVDFRPYEQGETIALTANTDNTYGGEIAYEWSSSHSNLVTFSNTDQATTSLFLKRNVLIGAQGVSILVTVRLTRSGGSEGPTVATANTPIRIVERSG